MLVTLLLVFFLVAGITTAIIAGLNTYKNFDIVKNKIDKLKPEAKIKKEIKPEVKVQKEIKKPELKLKKRRKNLMLKLKKKQNSPN